MSIITNIGITMDIYSHVLTGMQKKAADSIEEGLEITHGLLAVGPK